MALDNWQPARLIPTSGINGPDEAERRATSALLAVVGAVRDFGLSIIKPLGAPAGQINTFIEVPFKLGERTVSPDGLIETGRAGRTWTALVEVKTGAMGLERDQVECYLDVARENHFDVVLTVSNQMSPAPDVHPVDVDKRKLRRVALHHLSWAEVLTVAVQQRVHRGVDDPDQAWILQELIRYLEHPKSGALDFADMGSTWVGVREAVEAGTLRASDKGLAEVISRWEQLLRFAALRLGRELGADVQVALSRKEVADPGIRIAAQAKSLVASGVLSGSLRIPDAVAPLDITTDLRAGRVTVFVEIDAPREGRTTTRVNWLIRQLRDAPDGLRIDGLIAASRSSTSELLRVVRENPAALIADPKRDLRSFRVAASSPMGTKRGTGRGGFIDSVLAAIDGFYGTVLQELRPWSARAPQLPSGIRTATEEAGIDLEPPPEDLREAEPPAEASQVGAETEAPIPDEVADALSSVHDDEVEDEAAGDLDAPEELVSWDAAHDRLDHERELESASENPPSGPTGGG